MSDQNIQQTKSANYEVKQFNFIVAVHNVEQWLPKCLKSIEVQTCDNYNVILVDYGSTDNSSNLCDKFVESHDNSMVLHTDDIGLVAARNCGVKHAEGEFICTVDGQDWIAKDYIYTLDWVVNQSPDNQERRLDMVYFSHKAVYYDHIDTYRAIDTVGYFDRQELKELIFPTIFKMTSFLSAWTAIFRKDILEKFSFGDDEASQHEDFAFTYECLYNAEHIYVVPKVLYYYNRQGEDKESRKLDIPNNFKSRLRSIIYIYNRFKDEDKEILDQLCYSFFMVSIYDFFALDSAKEASIFKKNLDEESIELIKQVTDIISELLNNDVEGYNTIRRGVNMLKNQKFRSLFHLANLNKMDVYEELIY